MFCSSVAFLDGDAICGSTAELGVAGVDIAADESVRGSSTLVLRGEAPGKGLTSTLAADAVLTLLSSGGLPFDGARSDSWLILALPLPEPEAYPSVERLG